MKDINRRALRQQPNMALENTRGDYKARQFYTPKLLRKKLVSHDQVSNVNNEVNTPVKGSALSLESEDDVERSDSLSLGVLSVGD